MSGVTVRLWNFVVVAEIRPGIPDRLVCRGCLSLCNLKVEITH
jgi:hypothetical protein